MALKRMDNVLIVGDDLEAVKAFFIELGLTLEGKPTSARWRPNDRLQGMRGHFADEAPSGPAP